MAPLLETKTVGIDPTSTPDLKVPDAVWIGTALLHESSPSAAGFPVEEIARFVEGQTLTKGTYRSILQNVDRDCVANRKPRNNRASLLYAIDDRRRRLFRSYDPTEPGRKDAPTHPDWSKLPPRFQYLREWYEQWESTGHLCESDPLLRLIGTGKVMFGDKGATPTSPASAAVGTVDPHLLGYQPVHLSAGRQPRLLRRH